MMRICVCDWCVLPIAQNLPTVSKLSIIQAPSSLQLASTSNATLTKLYQTDHHHLSDHSFTPPVCHGYVHQLYCTFCAFFWEELIVNQSRNLVPSVFYTCVPFVSAQVLCLLQISYRQPHSKFRAGVSVLSWCTLTAFMANLDLPLCKPQLFEQFLLV